MSIVPVSGQDFDGAEVSWFAPLCSDDYRYLGVPDGKLRSNFENTSNIVKIADRLGFRNILCPSSYQVGQDTLTFASAVAPMTDQINLLTAIRCGELHPLMLARSIATLDHILTGRLTLNIISSNMPGENAGSSYRYKRSAEVVEILKQVWDRDSITYEGEFYKLNGLSSEPVKPYQQNGGPLLYFGGYSPQAIELCARYCDVYLMWPETQDKLAYRMQEMNATASKFDRVLDYGLRVHVIVRKTESEAKEYADSLVSRLDDEEGRLIRERALDSSSKGVRFQAESRQESDAHGYAESGLWTGVGRARSGCGAALVGGQDKILSKLETYRKMGIRSFIFSGYPHKDECEIFGDLVMPQLKTVSLPELYGRVPKFVPKTPLGDGIRQ